MVESRGRIRGLAPVPDRTGEPRPPRAPQVMPPWALGTFEVRVSSLDADDDHRFRARGEYPTDAAIAALPDEPVLEEASAPPRLRARLGGGLAFAGFMALQVIVIGGIVMLVVSGFGIEPAHLWGLGMFAFVLAVWGFFGGVVEGFTPVSARVSAHHVDVAGDIVGLYDLVRVEVADRGDRAGRPHLVLVDQPGHRVALPLGLLTAHPPLWDLVHHGIRHSVADGADVDEATFARLRLGDEPVPAPPRPGPPPWLPPPPDVHGLPAPPPAPQVVRPWTGRRGPRSSHHLPASRTAISLSAHRRHGRLRAAAFGASGCLPMALLITLIPVALVLFGVGGNIDGAWNFALWAAAVILTFGLVMGWFDRRSVLLQVSPRQIFEAKVGDGVALHRIRRIRLRRTVRAGPVLRLADDDGHRIAVPIGLLVARPDAWNRVYLGLVHSATTGADVDDRARALLDLPRGDHPRR